MKKNEAEINELFAEVESMINESMQTLIMYAAMSSFKFREIIQYRKTEDDDYEYIENDPPPNPKTATKKELSEWRAYIQKDIAEVNPKWLIVLEMKTDSMHRAIINCELESPLGHWTASWKNQSGFYSDLQVGFDFKEKDASEYDGGGLLYKKKSG